MNCFPGVVVGDFRERPAKRNLNAQFLAKFPNEAIFKGFARLAFASGELPQASQVTTLKALSDEDLLLVENQASSDVDGLNGQCSYR